MFTLCDMMIIIKDVEIYRKGDYMIRRDPMGLDGVLWSMPVSDLLTGIISLFVVAYTFRELKKE